MVLFGLHSDHSPYVMTGSEGPEVLMIHTSRAHARNAPINVTDITKMK